MMLTGPVSLALAIAPLATAILWYRLASAETNLHRCLAASLNSRV
jgi:hypothetical protein